MDSRNFAIGVLSTTATILLVGVVLLYSRPDEARAEGMTTSGGGYILTVGSLSRNDEELVYVLDTSTDKMIAYRFDASRRQMELFQGIDLGDLKRPSTPTDPQQPVQPVQPAKPKPRTRQP